MKWSSDCALRLEYLSMMVTALSIPVVFLLFSFTLRGAEPHAQQGFSAGILCFVPGH